MSMLSFLDVSFASQNCTTFTKAYYQAVQNNCNKKLDDMTFLHRRFGHLSSIILMHLLKSCTKLKVSLSSSQHSYVKPVNWVKFINSIFQLLKLKPKRC